MPPPSTTRPNRRSLLSHARHARRSIRRLAGQRLDGWSGVCPLCRGETWFEAEGPWLRDQLVCTTCPNGSLPRERAMMLALDAAAPDWRTLRIHEGSPVRRGLSPVLAAECPGYVESAYRPGVELGSTIGTLRCEDLERQTFPDGSFDIVVTQDVMEHVFDPASAYREIARTLKPGGLHLHTTPIYPDLERSERRAEMRDDKVHHLAEPEYHGTNRDLVTYHYGQDLASLIRDWSGVEVDIHRYDDRHHGILGEFMEVIACRKAARPA